MRVKIEFNLDAPFAGEKSSLWELEVGVTDAGENLDYHGTFDLGRLDVWTRIVLIPVLYLSSQQFLYLGAGKNLTFEAGWGEGKKQYVWENVRRIVRERLKGHIRPKTDDLKGSVGPDVPAGDRPATVKSKRFPRDGEGGGI